MPKAGDASIKLVDLKRTTDGGLGAKPLAVARFFAMFWKKKAVQMPLGHISQVFRAI